MLTLLFSEDIQLYAGGKCASVCICPREKVVVSECVSVLIISFAETISIWLDCDQIVIKVCCLMGKNE